MRPAVIKPAAKLSEKRLVRIALGLITCAAVVILIAAWVSIAKGYASTAAKTTSRDSKRKHGAGEDANKRSLRLRHMLAWARANGASVNFKAELDDTHEAGWGWFANNALDEGEMVCQIPSSLLIGSNEEGSQVFNLATMLLKRKHMPYEESLPWETALTAFPKDLETEIELAMQGSDGAWDEMMFRKAVFLVRSRVHATNDGEGQRRLAMVPIADMFNFGYEPNVKCTGENLFICRTTKKVLPDEALTVVYRSAEDAQILTNKMLNEVWGI